MKRNPSSDIPKARRLLIEGMQRKDWDYVHAALLLMTRAKAVRRARRKQGRITEAQKRKVLLIAMKEPDTHYHEIADRVGLTNGGRVSEIVTGKRK